MVASEIPFEIMRPVEWKKAMGVTVPRGTPREKRKKVAKELAIVAAKRLFPTAEIGSHDKAEALLLEAKRSLRLSIRLMEDKAGTRRKL